MKKIENFFLVINNFTIQYNIIMSTIQFNSKGQRIEELDSPLEKVEPNIIIPSAFSSAEPFYYVSEKVDNPLSLSSSRRVPFQKVDNPLAQTCSKVDNPLAPPFQKVEEDEILAWCEYYLHSKKIERKLSHIYFPSTFSTFSTFKKGSA